MSVASPDPSGFDVEAFAAHLRGRGRAAATIAVQRKVTRSFERWMAPRPLGDAGVDDVARWLDSLVLTPTSRDSYISHLRAYYRWALAAGLVDHDPTRGVRRPPVAKLKRPGTPARAAYGGAGLPHLAVVPPDRVSLAIDRNTAVGRLRIFEHEMRKVELADRTIRLYLREIQIAEFWCEAEGYSLRNVPGLVLGQFVALRPKSHSSRRHIRTAFQHYWRVFKRKDPPLWVVKVPKKPRMVCRALDPEEAQRLAALARGHGGRAGLAVLLAMYQGLRREEISMVAWADLTDDGWLKLIGKGDLPAKLPVHPVVAEALARLPHEDSRWVFPGRVGDGHASPATVWSWVKRLAADAGLENVSTHRLRHTCLATANDATGDLRAVQDFARHAKIDTTAGYTRTTERRLRDVLAAIRYELDEPLINEAPTDPTDIASDPEWARLMDAWVKLAPAARRILALTAEQIVAE